MTLEELRQRAEKHDLTLYEAINGTTPSFVIVNGNFITPPMTFAQVENYLNERDKEYIQAVVDRAKAATADTAPPSRRHCR